MENHEWVRASYLNRHKGEFEKYIEKHAPKTPIDKLCDERICINCGISSFDYGLNKKLPDCTGD